MWHAILICPGHRRPGRNRDLCWVEGEVDDAHWSSVGRDFLRGCRCFRYDAVFPAYGDAAGHLRMNLAGVGKRPGRIEHNSGHLTGIDHSSVETGSGGGMLVVVGIDERHCLPQVDGQFPGIEPTSVIADDANFDRPLRNDP